MKKDYIITAQLRIPNKGCSCPGGTVLEGWCPRVAIWRVLSWEWVIFRGSVLSMIRTHLSPPLPDADGIDFLNFKQTASNSDSVVE